MYKKLFLMIITLIAVFAVSGCRPAPEPEPPPPSPPLDSGAVMKYNAYADLVNVITNELNRAIGAYADEFGLKQTVYIENGFSGCDIPPNNITEMLETAELYAGTEPHFNGTDDAFSEMLPVLKEYASALNNAAVYYGGKGYLDDSFASAGAYHDVIAGMRNEVFEKTETFFAAFYDYSAGLDELHLQYYLETDYMLRYYALLTLCRAGDLAAAFGGAEYSAAFAGFSAAYDCFFELYSEAEAQMEGMDNSGVFADALKDMNSAAERYDTGTAGKSLRSYADALTDAYNAMFDTIPQ